MFHLKRLHENNDRDRFLDLLRGAAMLMVFYHHAGGSGALYILGFHMPLFFLLSGYLFSLNKSLDRAGGGTAGVVLSGC